MSNLYARLVSGEDERTEALADLLERILVADRRDNKRRFGDFVARVLLAKARDERAKIAFLHSIIQSPDALSVVTQYRIRDGTIPDMVVFRGSDPVCVVEVKIDAAIGEGQVAGYGGWLAERARNRYTPALVLLTHVTPPPAGFAQAELGSFGVKLRSVASWNAAADWFAELGSEESDVNEPLKTLAQEYGEFLKEDAMPTLDDAAIARHYLAHSHQKLIGAVVNMQAGYEFPHNWSKGPGVYEQEVGIWKFHYPEKDHNTRNVYCGLCFNPLKENDDALHGYTRYENGVIDDPKPVVIGDGFYAFVCIDGTAEDCRHIPGFVNSRWYERVDGVLVESEEGPQMDSTGWWHYSMVESSRAGYARICALQELLDEDGRMDNRLEVWTHSALWQTVQLWKDRFGAGG